MSQMAKMNQQRTPNTTWNSEMQNISEVPKGGLELDGL